MSKGAERRRLRRQKRQEAREARRAAKSGARTERQKNRQGFLSGIIGDKGIGGLVEQFQGGDDLDTGLDGGGGKSGEGEDDNNMMMYVLIGLGAYFLMQKK